MERLRAELRQTGGFAGLTRNIQVDTATMPPADAVRLVQLADMADLSAIERGSSGRTRGADLMHYELTVERGGRRWHGTLSDPDIPPGIRPLLQFLTHYSPPATP